MCCLYTSSLICILTACGFPVLHPLLSVHVDLKQGLAACVQSEHTPTDTAPVSVHFRFLFGTPLHHPVQAVVSLEESFIMHSRLGLACSHAPSHSLCELPPLKPPLIVPGTVVQVLSSLRGLCSMLPWHSMVAAPCHVPLTSCSTSSDAALMLCDACGDWTSGAGLCRRLVLGLRLPVSGGPGLSWDSRRAFHKSPPNEFDSHAPSSRGLSVHPSRCTPVSSMIRSRTLSQKPQLLDLICFHRVLTNFCSEHLLQRCCHRSPLRNSWRHCP